MCTKEGEAGAGRKRQLSWAQPATDSSLSHIHAIFLEAWKTGRSSKGKPLKTGHVIVTSYSHKGSIGHSAFLCSSEKSEVKKSHFYELPKEQYINHLSLFLLGQFRKWGACQETPSQPHNNEKKKPMIS